MSWVLLYTRRMIHEIGHSRPHPICKSFIINDLSVDEGKCARTRSSTRRYKLLCRWYLSVDEKNTLVHGTVDFPTVTRLNRWIKILCKPEITTICRKLQFTKSPSLPTVTRVRVLSDFDILSQINLIFLLTSANGCLIIRHETSWNRSESE